MTLASWSYHCYYNYCYYNFYDNFYWYNCCY